MVSDFPYLCGCYADGGLIKDVKPLIDTDKTLIKPLIKIILQKLKLFLWFVR